MARLHARIGQLRNDALHKLTSKLAGNFKTVVVENLNVKGMMKNGKLARSIADMGFFEFRRQLGYKTQMRAGLVMVADRWFASSKMCSSCGHKLETLSLSIRSWVCPVCGKSHDRDVNAAINLRNIAASTASSAES